MGASDCRHEEDMENLQKDDQLRSFRFSPEVDRYVRRPGMRRGDVKERIVKPLLEMDADGFISKNNLTRMTRKLGPSKAAGTYYITTATMPRELYERLRAAALEKRMSIALFVDRLLLAYYKNRKSPEREDERERLLAESQKLLSQFVSFQLESDASSKPEATRQGSGDKGAVAPGQTRR